MFDDLFVRKKLNVEKAIAFGFEKAETGYQYEIDIYNDMFRLKIVISHTETVDTVLTEKESGEEYVLYKTNSPGAFIGEIRSTVEAMLIQVADNCFDTEIFKLPQSKEVINYIRNKYGDEPEYLWKKFPDNAVWRRKDTSKWYGAILTVSKRKLGIDSDEKTEIIDLRIQPDKMVELLKNDNFYPGWHMNKKNWFTIILDGSVDTDEICRCIETSYQLAL